MITKIYAVWVYVKDLPESRRFYEEVLGLKTKYQEGQWLEFDLGATTLALHERPKDKGPLTPQKTRIMLEVDDIQTMQDRLHQQGTKLIGSIRAESYGKLLTFEDPNGHWLELFEPKS